MSASTNSDTRRALQNLAEELAEFAIKTSIIQRGKSLRSKVKRLQEYRGDYAVTQGGKPPMLPNIPTLPSYSSQSKHHKQEDDNHGKVRSRGVGRQTPEKIRQPKVIRGPRRYTMPYLHKPSNH